MVNCKMLLWIVCALHPAPGPSLSSWTCTWPHTPYYNSHNKCNYINYCNLWQSESVNYKCEIIISVTCTHTCYHLHQMLSAFNSSQKLFRKLHSSSAPTSSLVSHPQQCPHMCRWDHSQPHLQLFDVSVHLQLLLKLSGPFPV